MNVSTKQQRIAELAQQHAGEALTNLHPYLDVEWLREAYRRTRKDGAPGIDGETWESYGEGLEANLVDLLNRVKSGRYRAPPVRRVNIPKGNGTETRPIGIPTLEDKVLQRAVLMLLEPILEREFHPHSYGFRPGRSAHQALAALWEQCSRLRIEWIVDADLRKYFDTIDKQHLRDMLRKRVRDGVIDRLVGKWLNAGVLEEGVWWCPERGTPQGGVLSPLLSNLYLHDVLDEWLVREVPAHLKGGWFITRFADDYVLGFERREDAERVLQVLPKRFARYGLSLHPEKTRLVAFGRPVTRDGRMGNGQSPGTFDFLGFTHYWGRSRKGRWVLMRKTAKDRLNRGLKSLYLWCKRHRHRKLREQHAAICRKLRGHDAYYGITGNARSLRRFRSAFCRIWRKWLNRRSRRPSMSWDRFSILLRDHLPLPPARVVHSIYAANP
jgi:group II intron reverse transcriptase/maturase